MTESKDNASKLVVVTGASRGLGLATCRHMVVKGYRVVGLARTASDELLKLAEHGECFFRSADLQQVTEIHALCNSLVEEYGRPYALVNNAALGLDGILTTMHESDIRNMLSVNVEAPILLCKYLSRPMLLNQIGRIVNVASVVAATGYKGLAAYGASKAALVGLTKSLCRELGQAGITVNCVAPGFMHTDMTSEIESERLASIKRRSPLGKLVDIDQVAACIEYLISEEASGITGSVFTIDAGSTA